MLGGAVVPDCKVARLPYSANSVLQLGDSSLQQVEQRGRLRRAEPDELFDEPFEEYGVPYCVEYTAVMNSYPKLAVA